MIHEVRAKWDERFRPDSVVGTIYTDTGGWLSRHWAASTWSTEKVTENLEEVGDLFLRYYIP